MGALSGVRVLDFTRVLAGPLCTMILGDLGADVIKIENPYRGDDTRQWGPPWVGDGEDRQSAYYLSVNRNKRSITLNIKHETGQKIAKELARKSHIVIENFKVGQMAEFGLGYDQLRELNPSLVYCSITGYGQTGPYANYPGYDYVIQAMSGLMSITGPVDGAPHKVGVAISDVIAGLYAATSVQAALRHAEHTGEGQYIDVALLDTQIASLVNIASNFLVSGTTPPRLGNQHPNIVPYQTFRASDGEFVLAVGNDQQFKRLCELIDHPEWQDDASFASNPARVQNREILIKSLQAIFLDAPLETWLAKLRSANIPCGPINDVSTILNDAQISARGLIQETTLANGDNVQYIGSPVTMSQTPPELLYPPPAHGQHTREILHEILGYDETQITELQQDGLV